MSFLFRFYYKTLGDHMHFRVFSGEKAGLDNPAMRNWGHCGTFTMRYDEGRAFIEVLKRGSGDGGEVQIVEE